MFQDQIIDGAHSMDQKGPPSSETLQLRPYQALVTSRILDAVERRILLVAPTGSGKTLIAVAIIRHFVSQGLRVMFVTHRREITNQTSRKLYESGVDHGIIQAGFPPRLGERVQIASIQTVTARAFRTRSMELPPSY